MISMELEKEDLDTLKQLEKDWNKRSQVAGITTLIRCAYVAGRRRERNRVIDYLKG